MFNAFPNQLVLQKKQTKKKHENWYVDIDTINQILYDWDDCILQNWTISL